MNRAPVNHDPRTIAESEVSTPIERALLFTMVCILPFQTFLPTVRGISAGFLIFVAIAGYAVLFRPDAVTAMLKHRIFLWGIAFVAVAFSVELIHGDPNLRIVFRLALMMAGGILVGALCRDRAAMTVVMCAFLVSATVLSVLLYTTSYDALVAGSSSSFQESSQLRMETVGQNPLEADLNSLSFMIGLGVVVAAAFGLAAKSRKTRLLMLPIGVFCLVGCFLPMSRGGLLGVAASCAMVALAFGVVRIRTLLVGAALAAAVYMLVPEAVFNRINPETVTSERGDRRPVLYREVVERLPDYFVTGVGVHAYFGDWGRRTEFSKGGRVSGSHNVFSQVTLYWGVAGLLTLGLTVLMSIRAIEWFGSVDPLRLALLGIGVSVFIHAMLVHTIEGKEFALVLGLTAAASTWIWPPKGTPLPATGRPPFLPRPEAAPDARLPARS